MKCTHLDLGNGVTGIVCSRGKREYCQTPGCRGESVALCDYPTPGGRKATCDRRMCRSCRSPQQGEDRDFCPPHARATKAATP